MKTTTKSLIVIYFLSIIFQNQVCFAKELAYIDTVSVSFKTSVLAPPSGVDDLGKDWEAIVTVYRQRIEDAKTEAELKKLWRAMALDVHPDCNPDDSEAANDAFKELKKVMENKKIKGFQEAARDRNLSDLPLWMYDLDFYEKEKDGISGAEIMNSLLKQKEKNRQDLTVQMSLLDSLVTGEILHIELPVNINTREPTIDARHRAMAVSVETAVVRVMVLAPLSVEGTLKVIPIETPFFGGGDFNPRVNVSDITREDILSRRVTIVREPLQQGDFSIKIGDQVEILLYGENWLSKEPFRAKATIVSNAWGSFTMVAHKPIGKNEKFYGGRGITLVRNKAEEMLAGGYSLRLLTPPHINPEMIPILRYDYSLTIELASNYNRFQAIVCEVVQAIEGDASHYLHGLKREELELIVEQKVRSNLVQAFKDGDTDLDIKQTWHMVDRRTGTGAGYQKQVYRNSMYREKEGPFAALPYLGGIALDRIQFGENQPRYPVKKSLEVRQFSIVDAGTSNQSFHADGEKVHIYEYDVIIATENQETLNFSREGGFSPLRTLGRFIHDNPGPYRLVKYEYGEMLPDYERDGFYLETSEPLFPFQELPEEETSGREYWEARYRKNIEYLKDRQVSDPEYCRRIIAQVTEHVYDMIAAGLHVGKYGWHLDNWHLTTEGKIKLFKINGFQIVGATDHLLPHTFDLATAIVEWIVDFRKVFRDVDSLLEEEFIGILETTPGLFYQGESVSTALSGRAQYAGGIQIPDPDDGEGAKYHLVEEIGDSLKFRQKGTLKKRKTMKPVPVLIPEGEDLYRLRDVAIQELNMEQKDSNIDEAV